jgi:hypothetical protein
LLSSADQLHIEIKQAIHQLHADPDQKQESDNREVQILPNPRQRQA